MPPTAGRVIAGRYFLEESIGHGGMSVVWRAHDRLLDRKVAVKEVVLPATIDASELADRYQRTKREVRTAARLNHRGIVAVYDVAEDDDRLWIVMELLQSPSLDQILASQGPLTAPRAARIGQQLLAALAAAHAAGVLHRDVKPSNVLIVPGSVSDDGDERAVLTDFGTAQFAGATPASDLWSLGATLYAAVEGHGPYERDSVTGTLSANTSEPPPPARSAGQLAPLIAALMRLEPSARPSAAVADRMFAEILSPMRAEHAPTLPVPTAPDLSAPLRAPTQTFAQLPPQGPSQPRPAGPRRRLTLIARVAVVIVAVVVGGYLFWQGELSKTTAPAAAGEPIGPAGSTITLPPVPTKEPITPAASSATLPPVSTAPGIVKAIDKPDATTPADYTRESFSAAQLGTTAGFSIARPPGWQSVRSGQQVTLAGPDGTNVEIDLTKHVKSDMVAEANYLKVLHGSDFPGYRRIYGPPNQPLKKFILPEAIHQTLGGLWEFDWATGGNVQMREDVLLFNLDQQSYTIYSAGPAGTNDNEWNTKSLGTVSTILGTFEPVLS
jgi:tRNA A-37 threonylcarbamoyl transferase component Bud32